MKLLSRIVAEHGIGKRPLTEADFYQFCERHDISVIWTPQRWSCYVQVADRHAIVLSTRLHGQSLLWTMWHEAAHYLLHIGQPLSGLTDQRRAEREAEHVAKLAVYGPRARYVRSKPVFR